MASICEIKISGWKFMQHHTRVHVHVHSSEAQKLWEFFFAKRVWEGFEKIVRLWKFLRSQYLFLLLANTPYNLLILSSVSWTVVIHFFSLFVRCTCCVFWIRCFVYRSFELDTRWLVAMEPPGLLWQTLASKLLSDSKKRKHFRKSKHLLRS